MILMIDDVKMVNADMFYPYVSKALAHDMDSIANGDKLYEKLCEVEEPLEVMIHDFDDIPEESLEFAKGVLYGRKNEKQKYYSKLYQRWFI